MGCGDPDYGAAKAEEGTSVATRPRHCICQLLKIQTISIGCRTFFQLRSSIVDAI